MSVHESELLGAYVIGVLEGEEWAGVHAHLAECPDCRREVEDLRQMEAALGEIPPEALLDGPPPAGSGLLQETLDDVRASHRPRRYLWVLALLAAFALALAGGVLAGRSLAGPAPSSTGAATPPSPAAAAVDPQTGVSMTVAVTPAAGWVRVHATLSGVPFGSECRLFVVSADGARQQASSWLASSSPETVDGSALMAPADVDSVQAETYAGQILVTVHL